MQPKDKQSTPWPKLVTQVRSFWQALLHANAINNPCHVSKASFHKAHPMAMTCISIKGLPHIFGPHSTSCLGRLVAVYQAVLRANRLGNHRKWRYTYTNYDVIFIPAMTSQRLPNRLVHKSVGYMKIFEFLQCKLKSLLKAFNFPSEKLQFQAQVFVTKVLSLCK